MASVLGAVTTRYALEDHTHRSPVVFWNDGDAQTDAIVANRLSFITVTPNLTGVTNFCCYDQTSTSPGAGGAFASLGGGYENGVEGIVDTIAGGQQNNILSEEGNDAYNAILGGRANNIQNGNYCAILGGFNNSVGAGGFTTLYASVLGGANNQAMENGGVALGFRALSYTRGQEALASGTPDSNVSTAQASRVVISGYTSGQEPRESADLTTWIPNAQEITLQNNRSYLVFLEAVARRIGTNDTKTWLICVSLRVTGGNITIDDQTEVYSYSAASTALYTLTAMGIGSTLRVRFEVGTGNTHQVNVACQVRMTEVSSISFLGEP